MMFRTRKQQEKLNDMKLNLSLQFLDIKKQKRPGCSQQISVDDSSEPFPPSSFETPPPKEKKSRFNSDDSADSKENDPHASIVFPVLAYALWETSEK